MILKNRVLPYFKELAGLIKNNYIVIISFIVLSVLLEFISIPFASVFLLIFLMFTLSKTDDFKPGKGKILNFILFFILIILFVLLFTAPSTIFLMFSDEIVPAELGTSALIKTSIEIGTLLSLLFIFIPFRIFDTNDNIVKAAKYSFAVIKNNFFLFIVLILFLLSLNFVSIYVGHVDYFIYLIDIICMAGLYRLHVKNSIAKDIHYEN
ncbi:MAG: hypothetical protein WC234_01345 [Endomicrobiaceae bacterium]